MMAAALFGEGDLAINQNPISDQLIYYVIALPQFRPLRDALRYEKALIRTLGHYIQDNLSHADLRTREPKCRCYHADPV